MESKTIYANGSKGHHIFTLEINEVSTNVQENSSLISFNFTISAKDPSWKWYNWGNAVNYTLEIGENRYTGSIPNFNGSPTTLKSITNMEITHDEDGKKSIPISFSVVDTSGVYYTSGDANVNDMFKLTDLHTLPTINNVTLQETNSLLIGAGIQDNEFVANLSKKKYTINASVYDGATITNYRVTNKNYSVNSNTNEVTLDYTNNPVYVDEFDVNGQKILRPVITIDVFDSMNARTSIFHNFGTNIYIPYSLPNLITTSSNIKRNGQTSGKVKLNLKGTFFNGNIGSISNNVSISFAYWKNGDEESETYYDIPTDQYNIDGNNISINDWRMEINGSEITDIDERYSYKFKIKAIDQLGEINIIELTCPNGEYLMAKFKNRVDFKKITQKNHEVLVKPTLITDERLLGNVAFNYDFSVFSTLKISFCCYDGTNANNAGGSNVIWLDLTTKGQNIDDYIATNCLGYFTGADGSTPATSIMVAKFKVNENKNEFKAYFGYSGQPKNNDSQYFVSKIEGYE